MKIVIATPNVDDFRNEMVQTLSLICYHCGRRGDEMVRVSPQSCYIDDGRNICFDEARKQNADWLFFLDTDVQYTGDGDILEYMINMNKDVVTGIYYQGAPPYRPVIYDFNKDGLIENYFYVPEKTFTPECSGGGFLLISKKVMDLFTPELQQEMGRPFDFIFDGPKLKLREDVAFFWRLKQLGIEVTADPGIKLSHWKKQSVMDMHWSAARKVLMDADKVNEGIPGWMTENELFFLAQMARDCTSIVEVGSWKGRSTKVFLDNCKGEVYAVDNWKGNVGVVGYMAEDDDIYSEFMNNVGHYSNLKILKGDSVDMAGKFNGNRADMVFLDADHTYEGCKSDIEAWLPKTNKVIAGHDYSPGWPGVIQAVQEKFGEVKTMGSIWFVELEKELEQA
jgi:hypothetical protein